MSTLALVAIFCVAAGAIWIAGSYLSKATDVFDEHFHLGEALGGLIFLAVSTNLPEIAIVASASLHHDMGLAIGNILGGIAIQTVVLVLLDGAGMRKRGPLTYEAASLVLVLEALVLIGILILSITGTLMPRSLIFLRMTPVNIAIATLWVVGLLLIRKARAEIPWQLKEREAMHGAKTINSKRKQPERITGTALAFIAACMVTLAAGVGLEETSSILATRIGMTGVLFGSTILAAATSLPEVTTGFASLKFGGYELAMSDIIGGNAFLPVLFVAATLLSGNPVLPDAKNTDVYLAGLGVLLTMIYAIGLLFRSKRKILGMGVDSLLVLGCYLVGLGGLFAVAHFRQSSGRLFEFRVRPIEAVADGASHSILIAHIQHVREIELWTLIGFLIVQTVHFEALILHDFHHRVYFFADQSEVGICGNASPITKRFEHDRMGQRRFRFAATPSTMIVSRRGTRKLTTPSSPIWYDPEPMMSAKSSA